MTPRRPDSFQRVYQQFLPNTHPGKLINHSCLFANSQFRVLKTTGKKGYSMDSIHYPDVLGTGSRLSALLTDNLATNESHHLPNPSVYSALAAARPTRTAA